MVGKTETRTQSDNRRFDALSELGCLACNIEFWPGTACEVHHVLNGGRRGGHQRTLGLCAWHHRGIVADVFRGNLERMKLAYGPSLAHEPRAFYARYGSNDELLIIQDSLVRMVQSARRRGEYFPPSDVAEATRQMWREVRRRAEGG